MQKLLTRLFPLSEPPEVLSPGVTHRMIPEDVEQPNRLHLRIDPDGRGLLLVNAAIVLHLNTTAAEHVYYWLKGKSEQEAAKEIARRYRVSSAKALKNQRDIREQVMRLADTPDLDPVLFIGIDRAEPFSVTPPAPYRLDCALTYRTDRRGTFDPLARARVDEELTTDDWKEILKSAWDFGIPHVTFTGGEPCLWDDLPELVRFSEELGQVTGLLTNGHRLGDYNFLKNIDLAGLDHILITHDPGTAESVSGLEAALATDIFTAVHLLINDQMDLNHLEVLQSKGVAAFSLSTSGEDLEILQRARDLAAELGVDLIWDLPTPYSSRNPISLEVQPTLIGEGRAWLYVEPDGDILPSQGIDRILGNTLRDPWSEIWDQAQAWHGSQTGSPG